MKAAGFGEAELRQQQLQRWGIEKFKELTAEQIETLYEFFDSIQQVQGMSTAPAASDAPVPALPFETPAEPPPPEPKRIRRTA